MTNEKEQVRLATLTIYAKDYEDTITGYEQFGFQIMSFKQDTRGGKETIMKIKKESELSLTVRSIDMQPYPNCVSLTLSAKWKYHEKEYFEYDLLRHDYVEVRD